jgi:hypothetical protein
MSMRTMVVSLGCAFVLVASSSNASSLSSAPATTAPSLAEAVKLGPPPAGRKWNFVGTQSVPGGARQVMVLDGETSLDWTQMVEDTVIAHPLDPKQWGQNFIAQLQKACGKLEIISQEEKEETDPARAAQGLPATYETYSGLLHCEDPHANPDPSVTVKKHEVIWFKAMHGFGQFSHLVERDWHGDELGPDNVLVSDATRKEWHDWIDGVSLVSMPGQSPPPARNAQP